jgi:transcriptional regulator with XRE-family HTH domain/tetratricopeptide (TPR) repeat protein
MALSGPESHGRLCSGCGRLLSRYNDGSYCGSCSSVSERGIAAEMAGMGARLRALRHRRGMSLEVLAGLSGKSAAYLSMIENGKRPLDRYSLIVSLAEALGVPAAEIAPAVSAGAETTDAPGGKVGREGLPGAGSGAFLESPQWCTDALTDLAEIGRLDLHAGPERRCVLAGAVYSTASAALPDAAWWQSLARPLPAPSSGRRRAKADDVFAVQQLAVAFSRIDQQLGGGHGRKALAQYLHGDAAALLAGGFATEPVRCGMFTAIGELAYLSGWMAFDNSEHALAQRYFRLALKLAARAGNSPLAGHVIRAMAHQAMDADRPTVGLELSVASIDGKRYLSAAPRERALLGVVHARALAVTGQKQAAAKALLRAEDDLASAVDGDAEPHRASFFAEASLAHETGRTLQACGDVENAIGHFQRSVRTRAPAYRRTHVVTLGYLGAAHIAAGNIEEACSTWSQALDVIEDGAIYSARARQAIADMRRLVAPMQRRKIPAIAEIDERAARYLVGIG